MKEQGRYSAVMDLRQWLLNEFSAGRVTRSVDSEELTSRIMPDLRYWSAEVTAVWTAASEGDGYWCAKDIARLVYEASLTLEDFVLHEEWLPSRHGMVLFDGGIMGKGMSSVSKGTDSREVKMTGLIWCTVSVWERPDSLRTYYTIGRTHKSPGYSMVREFVAWFPLIAGPDEAAFGWPTAVIAWDMGTAALDLRVNVDNPFGLDRDTYIGGFRSCAMIIGALLCFLKQRILVAGNERADRASRRRAEVSAKKLNLELQEYVKVVKLRVHEYRKHDDVSDSEREYQCRWIVRGHWRNQWYGRLGIHQPKWIEPYVKGPEDKPLRAPKETVFAVVR